MTATAASKKKKQKKEVQYGSPERIAKIQAMIEAGRPWSWIGKAMGYRS